MAKRLPLPKLPNVRLFDHLRPFEYESLFLRTQRTLEDIKIAYEDCCNGPLNRAKALQFAIDPAGLIRVDPDQWEAYSTGDGLILCQIAGESNLKYVHDRITIAVLKLFVKDPESFNWIERIAKDYDPEHRFTAGEITKAFDVPRSTLQSWQEVGIRGAKLAPINCLKDEQGRATYVYRDLQPFIEYYWKRKSESTGHRKGS